MIAGSQRGKDELVGRNMASTDECRDDLENKFDNCVSIVGQVGIWWRGLGNIAVEAREVHDVGISQRTGS